MNPTTHRAHLSSEKASSLSKDHRLTFTFALTPTAKKEDLVHIENFCREHNFDIAHLHYDNCHVRLSGKAENINRALGINLKGYTHDDGKFYHGHLEEITLPEELREHVAGVVGLSNHQVARPYFRKNVAPKEAVDAKVAPRAFNPNEVAQLYNFPEGGGAGQSIALIELGGGYRNEEMQTYFNQIGVPLPNIVSISVDGATNNPADANASGEVCLDIQVVGGVAPKANILVIFAPNTDQGFYNAIMAAVNNTHYSPKIISISWGSGENNWTSSSIKAMESAFQVCVRAGISVFVAAGDNGYTDGESGKLAHVDYPASSPNATGCGGTYLLSQNGQIVSETVWDDNSSQSATGGGISSIFPVPYYQAKISNLPISINPGHKKGRAVPDCSGVASPNTGYNIYFDGQWQVIGGTSSVAPLWAGLTAILNSQLGKNLGFLNPIIYQVAVEKTFHDITSGNNGGYSAKKGFDCCTGWGSPDGNSLLNALKSSTSSHPGPAPSPHPPPSKGKCKCANCHCSCS